MGTIMGPKSRGPQSTKEASDNIKEAKDFDSKYTKIQQSKTSEAEMSRKF